MKNQIKKIISGNFTFFLIVLIGSLVVYFINPTLVGEVFSVFFSLLRKITPILLFVFALIFAFNLFIKPKVVAKYLGNEKGIYWMVGFNCRWYNFNGRDIYVVPASGRFEGKRDERFPYRRFSLQPFY